LARCLVCWLPCKKGCRTGSGEPSVEGVYEYDVDTTLIPPGTQYGARRCNLEQRKPPRNAGFVTFCKLLQRMTALVAGAGVSGSSPLVGSLVCLQIGSTALTTALEYA
jgi:hypothetical protein